MKAIVVDEGAPGRPLAWTEVPEPVAGAGEVLVRVRAAGVNRPDLRQRAGNYPPPPGASPILGLEIAGTIESVGPGVRGWEPGERVCALVTGGGYAQRATAPVETLMRVPDEMSDVEAAAFPETAFTAYTNLFLEGALAEGECVLVHAGASGVGTAAIQLAVEAGATVYATVGTDAKVEHVLGLGARVAVNYRRDDFAAVLRALPDFRGVDVIFDMVGRDYLERNLELASMRGRIVFVSLLSGSEVTLDLRRVMAKRLHLIGTTLRIRSLAEKRELRDGLMARFGDAWRAGRVRPVLDRVVPIERVEEAHAHMEADRTIGKLVLEVP